MFIGNQEALSGKSVYVFGTKGDGTPPALGTAGAVGTVESISQ